MFPSFGDWEGAGEDERKCDSSSAGCEGRLWGVFGPPGAGNVPDSGLSCGDKPEQLPGFSWGFLHQCQGLSPHLGTADTQALLLLPK